MNIIVEFYLLTNENLNATDSRGNPSTDILPKVINVMQILSLLVTKNALSSEIAKFIGKSQQTVGPILRNHIVPAEVVSMKPIVHSARVEYVFEFTNVFRTLWPRASNEELANLIDFIEIYTKICLHWERTMSAIKDDDFLKESILDGIKAKNPKIEEKWYNIIESILLQRHENISLEKALNRTQRYVQQIETLNYGVFPEQMVVDVFFPPHGLIDPIIFEKTCYEQEIFTDFHFTPFLYQFSQQGFRNRFRYLAHSEQLPRFFWVADRHYHNLLWKPIMEGIKRDINAQEKIKVRLEQNSEFKKKLLAEYNKLKSFKGFTIVPKPHEKQMNQSE